MTESVGTETDEHGLRRPLLYLLVGSVILGAALGIIIVLRDEWGWFEERVILTTITIAVASLCGLACDLSRTPRGTNLVPLGGLVLTCLATILILGAIWPEFDSDEYLKATGIVSIFAVATVHVSLLSIARLARRFAWVYVLTLQVIYGLAILLSAMIILEPRDEDPWFRAVAVISIVDAALTLLLPLLHRISKTDAESAGITTALDERNVAAIDQEISRLRKRITELEKLRSDIAGRAEDAP